MLKLANENMQTYKAIMKVSPSRPKTKVIKELNSVIKIASRSRSSKRKKLRTNSNKNTIPTDRSRSKRPTIEVSHSIVHPTELPTLNLNTTFDADPTLSSRRNRKSYRE
jgi:hypothetical protein